MTYQSPFPQSPFARPPEPPPLPTVMKPLQYCEFRVGTGAEYGQVPEVYSCAVFACEEIEGMAFCAMHAAVIKSALSGEQGVPYDRGDT